MSEDAPNPAVERPADIVDQARRWNRDGIPTAITPHMMIDRLIDELERLRAVERPADPRGWREAIEAAAKRLDQREKSFRDTAMGKTEERLIEIWSDRADIIADCAEAVRALSPAKDREGGDARAIVAAIRELRRIKKP